MDLNRRRSILSRIFLRPKFTFYFQAFWIIWKNSRKALKGVYTAEKWAESSCEILRALENIGTSITITGMANLRKFDGPAVFIANHMSTLETFVLPCIIQPVKPVTFVVKQSLVDTPVFGPIMRSRDPILVGRTNPREDLKAVLEGGTKRLQAGQSVIIFPQSTRSITFKPEEFNTLGIKLALKADPRAQRRCEAHAARTRPPEPLVMRLNVNDCATYYHTNLVPNVYELDDYQVRTPTDIIGQAHPLGEVRRDVGRRLGQRIQLRGRDPQPSGGPGAD